MRVRHLLLASMMVLGLVAVTAPANAATIAYTVDVFVNDDLKGTATAGGTTLDVDVMNGDTVTFIVGLASLPGANINLYGTTLSVDTSEITYIGTTDPNAAPPTGNDIIGLNFAAFADPNFASGNSTINSEPNNTASGLDFYRVDYTVSTAATDGVDFTLSGGNFSTTTGGDSANISLTATVALNASAVIPEPASMLLLGSGLAALAGFGRRKIRK